MSAKTTINYTDLDFVANEYVVGEGEQKTNNLTTLLTTIDVDRNFAISKEEWDVAIASGSINWLIDPFRRDEFQFTGIRALL
ncbi:hypothetical protein K1X76_06470 [bacterium]|nr:hypothetical protein [bacterium]